MKERPILFSGEMVRAILDGRKTQTRRVLRLAGAGDGITSVESNGYGKWFTNLGGSGFQCPYGKPGDHLWVRETWGAVSKTEDPAPPEECSIEYRADLPLGCTDQPGGWPSEDAKGNEKAPHWKPSIFMPRWASRIILEVMDVRVEQLQDISEEDCCREMGCPLSGCFKILWDSLNAKRGYSWDVNPFVWVISFRRI
jgi:hypothetical protein